MVYILAFLAMNSAIVRMLKCRAHSFHRCLSSVLELQQVILVLCLDCAHFGRCKITSLGHTGRVTPDRLHEFRGNSPFTSNRWQYIRLVDKPIPNIPQAICSISHYWHFRTYFFPPGNKPSTPNVLWGFTSKPSPLADCFTPGNQNYQTCTHSIAFYELMWYIEKDHMFPIMFDCSHGPALRGGHPTAGRQVLPWTMRWTQWPWLTRPSSRSQAPQGCRVDTGSDPRWTSPAPAPWRWWELLLNNAKFTIEIYRECSRDI